MPRKIFCGIFFGQEKIFFGRIFTSNFKLIIFNFHLIFSFDVSIKLAKRKKTYGGGATMSSRELFNCYHEAWKVISDYIEWVAGGGECLYGSIEVAQSWAAALLAAQSKCF